MVFAGSRGMREEEISQEWNELSVDERNKWEKRAAAECDVQHNRECFVSSLLKLLQGCLQFGHIGHGEIARSSFLTKASILKEERLAVMASLPVRT
ncbi:hypothetical protein BT96DRAFT_1003852 [Gymnopus androsaceus JB14]|uniref:Uncharacterized protein n=1 Tax=Gymnopus androsaceus JB14 TaxID=1447944 RepID=A0A6A4GSL8_9AGAR|nr:hypothetical protein BT96DRAFT_1003852 [Gymnopus androsaceus JB14]